MTLRRIPAPRATLIGLAGLAATTALPSPAAAQQEGPPVTIGTT